VCPGQQPRHPPVDLAPDGRAANLRRVVNGCFTSWRSDFQAFLACQFATFRGLPDIGIWLTNDRAAANSSHQHELGLLSCLIARRALYGMGGRPHVLPQPRHGQV
jgi:hypothetical protein